MTILILTKVKLVYLLLEQKAIRVDQYDVKIISVLSAFWSIHVI